VAQNVILSLNKRQKKRKYRKNNKDFVYN